MWDPLFISATGEASNFKFNRAYITWVWSVAYQERTFRTKTGGGPG